MEAGWLGPVDTCAPNRRAWFRNCVRLHALWGSAGEAGCESEVIQSLSTAPEPSASLADIVAAE